jgi:hypothetical protein
MCSNLPARAGVEAFRVALLANGQRRGEIDLDEIAVPRH